MTKLVLDGAAKAVNEGKLNSKEGRATAEGSPVANAAAAAALAGAVHGVPQAKAVPGVPAAPAKAKLDAAKFVRPDEDEKDKKHDDEKAAKGEGETRHLAMVDEASAAAVGTQVSQVAQDGTTGGGSGDDSSGGGEETALYVGGGLLAVGAIVAVAASGGDDDGDDVPANTAPTFAASTATASVDENSPATKVVFDANATDADAGDTITYSLSGADAAAFTINGSTGEVTLKASPDFEAKASYAFNVVATDKAGLTASQAVTLKVNDLNESPTITTGGTASVLENAAVSTVVYDANASDPDANTTITYSLQGTDAAAFNIDSKTGEVRLNASANFEAKSSYSIQVKATDSGNPALSATKDVTVSVENVLEAPSFAGQTASASIAENSPISTIVFDANATPEAGDTVKYSLSGTDAGLFNINETTGEVTLKSSANFEARDSYSFNVVATSGTNAGASSSQAVTLSVTDAVDQLGTDGGSINNPLVINAAGNPAVDVRPGADVNFQFNETQLLSEVRIENFSKNDFFSITGADLNDYSYQQVGDDLVLTYNPNGGDLSLITLVGVLNGYGGNPGEVVFDEATAEAALLATLGASDNAANGGYFVGTTSAPEDIVIPGGSSTQDGAGRAATFIENAANESTTLITNFGSDDTVAFTGGKAGDDVNDLLFSVSLTDANDLEIRYLNSDNNTVSVVTLDEVLSGNQAVFDFNSAATAIGRTDFVTFA